MIAPRTFQGKAKCHERNGFVKLAALDETHRSMHRDIAQAMIGLPATKPGRAISTEHYANGEYLYLAANLARPAHRQ
jgi:hypothetical protein